MADSAMLLMISAFVMERHLLIVVIFLRRMINHCKCITIPLILLYTLQIMPSFPLIIFFFLTLYKYSPFFLSRGGGRDLRESSSFGYTYDSFIGYGRLTSIQAGVFDHLSNLGSL